MASRSARGAAQARTITARDWLASWLFIFCTLLMLDSVIRMWSHWFEISTLFGSFRAAGLLGAITGAALVISWWLNTGNDG